MHEATAKGPQLNLNLTHATSTLRVMEGLVRLDGLATWSGAGLLGGRHGGVCRVLSWRIVGRSSQIHNCKNFGSGLKLGQSSLSDLDA
jgi:hypothetical protein